VPDVVGRGGEADVEIVKHSRPSFFGVEGVGVKNPGVDGSLEPLKCLPGRCESSVIHYVAPLA
jgi:hypothetical protein